MTHNGQPEGTRPYRVGIMGASLHTGNRGVSALGASLARLVWSVRPDALVSLLIGNRDAAAAEVDCDGIRRSVATVNYRLSPRAPLSEQLWVIVLLSLLYRAVPAWSLRQRIARSSRWIQFVADADFVGDIRGGDSFSDIYGVAGFLRGSLPVLSVIWVRGGIHLLPQTIGPFQSRLAMFVARRILLRAESIACRDRASLGEVARLTHGRRQGRLCPDVAFALEARRPEPLKIEPPLPPADRSLLIGVNVNGLVYHGGYTRANMFGMALDYPEFLRRMVEAFLADPAHRVILIPHTFAPEGSVESDPAASRDLIGRVPMGLHHRLHLVTHAYDQHEIKGVVGRCDFFIGSRMHACIAALSQGIPAVAVAYSRKFAGVFGVVGAEDWVVDGRSADAESALARVAALFAAREGSKADLARTVPEARLELARVLRHLMSAERNGGVREAS